MVRRPLALAMTIALLLSAGCASTQQTWKGSIDRQTKSRFIPIELWSGRAWTGGETLALRTTDVTFGKRNHKRIRGPYQWKHPMTGETLSVFERTNNTTKGLKRQLFTVNPDGTGLAKVFDERPGQKRRYFSSNAVLFPLGVWKKGEKRVFEYYEFVEGKRSKRFATIHIRRLYYEYKKTKYALKYDYIAEDTQGNVLYHENFIYGPGKGLMRFRNRLK